MNIGDTVRITTDYPHEAEVRAGECGSIVAVKEHGEQTVYTVKVGTKHWQILDGDFEPVDVHGDFRALMQGLDLDALMPLSELYDAPEPEMSGVPVDLVDRFPDPVAVDEDEDDEDDAPGTVLDHDNCPEGPHIHEDDGEAVPLPYLGLVDADGDRLLAVNITEASKDSSDPSRVFSVRLMSSRTGAVAEVHLTEAQALALGTFLFRQYGPNRSQ